MAVARGMRFELGGWMDGGFRGEAEKYCLSPKEREHYFKRRLHIKSKKHNVAVRNRIVFSFNSQQAFFFNGCGGT